LITSSLPNARTALHLAPADNFCFYNANYDNMEGAAEWARLTLTVHKKVCVRLGDSLASATVFAACFVALNATSVCVMLALQDEREAVYSLQELEEARTHDDLWVRVSAQPMDLHHDPTLMFVRRRSSLACAERFAAADGARGQDARLPAHVSRHSRSLMQRSTQPR
jgi:hypothetical protein